MSSVADVASVADVIDVIDEIDVTIPNNRTSEQPNRGVRVCSVVFGLVRTLVRSFGQ